MCRETLAQKKEKNSLSDDDDDDCRSYYYDYVGRSVSSTLRLAVCVCVSNILRGSSYHLTIRLAAATHNRTHIVV